MGKEFECKVLRELKRIADALEGLSVPNDKKEVSEDESEY